MFNKQVFIIGYEIGNSSLNPDKGCISLKKSMNPSTLPPVMGK